MVFLLGRPDALGILELDEEGAPAGQPVDPVHDAGVTRRGQLAGFDAQAVEDQVAGVLLDLGLYPHSSASLCFFAIAIRCRA